MLKLRKGLICCVLGLGLASACIIFMVPSLLKKIEADMSKGPAMAVPLLDSLECYSYGTSNVYVLPLSGSDNFVLLEDSCSAFVPVGAVGGGCLTVTDFLDENYENAQGRDIFIVTSQDGIPICAYLMAGGDYSVVGSCVNNAYGVTVHLGYSNLYILPSMGVLTDGSNTDVVYGAYGNLRVAVVSIESWGNFVLVDASLVPDVPRGSVSSLTVTDFRDRYWENFQGNKVVVIMNVEGVPLCAYSGDSLSVSECSEIRGAVRLSLDGKDLYVQGGGYFVIDKELP